jgi:hypothetical protein
MRKFHKILFVMVWFLASVVYAGGPINQIEIKSDPEKNGQRDFTVRILPNKTHKCDKVVFESVYQQQFPWENLQGEKYIKIYEPVAFTYNSSNVRLVADLDKYISFRVPVSLDLLKKAYGVKTFNAEYPVIIGHIKIKGIRGEEVLWHYDLKAGGLFKVGEKPVSRRK